MEHQVILKSSHVYFSAELVEKVFKRIHYAYVVYIEKQRKILITPVNSQWFVKMYKPAQILLKLRNLKGDKTLGIREILIDNDLDTTDRILQYELEKKINLIKISI